MSTMDNFNYKISLLLGGSACMVTGYFVVKWIKDQQYADANRSITGSLDTAGSSEDEREQNVQNEAKRLHHWLKNKLADEMGTDGLENITEMLKAQVPASVASSCASVRDVLNTMQERGLIQQGNYKKFTKLLKDTGYNDTKIHEMIEEVEKQIHLLLEPEQPPSSPFPLAIQEPSAPNNFKYDAVIMYTEKDQETARCLVLEMQQIDASFKIVLPKDLPIFGKPHFEAMEYMMTECRFVCFVVTSRKDNLQTFLQQACLHEFITDNQARVIPIWYTEDMKHVPMELALLTCLHPNRENFAHRFRIMINEGRRALPIMFKKR